MTDDITKDMTTDDKLDFLINAVSDIKQRQIALEELVHARLHDTRPLWEGVQQRLDAQQQQLDEIRAQLSRLDKKLDFAGHDNQRANLDLRADVALLTERMTTLEKAA